MKHSSSYEAKNTGGIRSLLKTFVSLKLLLDLLFRNLGTDDSIYPGLICRKVLVGKFGGLLKILKRVYG